MVGCSPLVSCYSIPLRRLAKTTNDAFAGEGFLIDDFIGDEPNSLLRCWLKPGFFKRSEIWPLVLVGPSGTGKTALAQTLASYVSPHIIPLHHGGFRDWRMYGMADFRRRRQAALETNSLADFRNEVCGGEGVIFDDLLQSTLPREVQLELIYLLDRAAAAGMPVIVTLARLPWSAPKLSRQLQSRLSSGLVLPVHLPGTVARARIIQKLGEQMDCLVESDAAHFLASHWPTTAAGLRHQLSQGLMRRDDGEKWVSLPAARSFVAGNAGSGDRVKKDVQNILHAVSKRYGLTARQIRGLSRRRDFVHARSIAIYLIREELQISFARIGEHFGGRDPSTVRHAFSQVAAGHRHGVEIEELREVLNRRLGETTG